MIRVRTGSRLHFGLFSLPGVEPAKRRFGGVGLMIEDPGLQIHVRPAASWSATGPLADRALDFARRFGAQGAFEMHVEACGPEHCGLGTGTQLALAVGHALARLAQQSLSSIEIAQRLGRGLRSALGLHGFDQGGLLVEAGKTSEADISPLVARGAFPEEWRVLLLLPRGARGLHGQPEKDAFAQLARQASPSTTDVLCRLTLLGMLPALHEKDLPAFGEALYEFNQRVGEMFRPAQGGVYAHPRTAEIVKFLRARGVHGVGQSSWGPAVFAILPADLAVEAATQVHDRFGLDESEWILTSARNEGAKLSYP